MPDTSKRCPGCYLPREQCMCQAITAVPCSIQIVVLRHVLECERNSNTGRLVAKALQGSEILEYANPQRPMEASRLTGEKTYLLYPQRGAQLPSEPPARIVLLDASWPQARRMAQRVPQLRGMPRLALPSPASALPRMREGAEPEQMSTAEAAIAALRLFGQDRAAGHLEELLRELVRRFSLPGRTGPRRGANRAK